MEYTKEQIMRLLPHQKSALLVDQAFAVEPGTFAKTQIYIDPAWQIFEGHFPGRPVFPGVGITEAMAQAAGVMLLSVPGNENLYPILFQMKQVTLMQPVYPGDTLTVEVTLAQSAPGQMYECKAKAYVEEKRVAVGTLTLCLKD